MNMMTNATKDDDDDDDDAKKCNIALERFALEASKSLRAYDINEEFFFTEPVGNMTNEDICSKYELYKKKITHISEKCRSAYF